MSYAPTMATRGITLLRGSVRALAVTAASAEQNGFSSAWTPEFYTRSAVVSLAAMANATSRVRLGSSIAYASGRSPLTLATEARSLDELSDGRLTLGLGLGTKRMMSDWHGLEPEAPAVRMEELVDLLRKLWRLHEGPVHHDGRFYRLHLEPTAEVAPPIRSDIPVFTAGVNSRMIQTAGRVADGLLGHPLFSRSYVDDVVRPAIDAGRAHADRPRAPVELVGIVICAISDDADLARREAAAQLAFYAAPKTYAAVLDAAGFGAVADAVRASLQAGDHAAMAAAVPDAMVDAMAAAGTADEVRARLVEAERIYDHVVVYPPSFGLTEERCDELASLLIDELAPRAETVIHG
jgi:probable F420-dependent oxidoreductase